MKKKIRVKPSKSQSVLGLIVGLIFVFIGITTISQMGAFGIVWTVIAIVITVTHGMNVFSDKGVATEVIEFNSENDLDSINGFKAEKIEEKYNFDEKLRKLKKLRDDGVLSELEYQIKKQEILEEKW
ncbi:SHOCT domain-containing protein [Clostridium sp. LIBA-8841]|uniref:SHOCT domain-containing protein n=1 Tax=Clostridium sp. LIBA-8841 TaxID=2987530 RepID=UPI002AC3EEC3|nr:SHOCT domain-containing protein [Clostridium sp. LIBA-8841]MDZ5255216.1 SHOCT domain-containing protein [Clostridium sp. LIBA-8841]